MALRRITYNLQRFSIRPATLAPLTKKKPFFIAAVTFAAEMRRNTLNMGAKGSPVDMIHNLPSICFESGPMLTPNKLVLHQFQKNWLLDYES